LGNRTKLSLTEKLVAFKNSDSFVRMHKIIFTICASIIVVLTSYGIVASIFGHVDVVGATLVNVEIPPISWFPITAKPISFLMVAALGITYSGYELARPSMGRFSKAQLSFFKMAAFIAATIAVYEVLYNFALWTAALASQDLQGILNPDVLIAQFPNPNTPWNLVFATKFYVTVLAVAAYTYYFIRSVEREVKSQFTIER
jgi:hypothetical protein